ncbi:MAG: hypothetical protein ACYC1Q_10815 [Bacteroidia bacterium]
MNFANYRIRLIETTDLEAYYLLIENNRERLEDFFTGTVSRTKTFEETGFEVEGRIRRDYKTTSGELVDLIYYGQLGNNG